jgi:hypothetical protein
MKCIACDSDRDYFFCGASIEEVNDQIIPMMKTLQKSSEGLRFPHLFVSSEKTLKKELEAQKKIKANPFVTKTILFHDYTGEIPDSDLYFVVNQKLDELYFVPFDIIYPERWGSHNPWGRVDKFTFKKLVALSTKPMTYDNGKVYAVQDPWTQEDVDNLVAKLVVDVKKLKPQGPEAVFNRVYPSFQEYRIWVEDLSRLFKLGNCIVGPDFFEMDQEQMHVVADYFDEKKPIVLKHRSFEEEKAICDKKDQMKISGAQICDEVVFDYLDGLIEWETVLPLVEKGWLDKYTPLEDKKRKRQLWLDHPAGEAVSRTEI